MAAREDQTLQELNLRRETWCRVEGGPRQTWDRAQRRHYKTHLQTSSTLTHALKNQPQNRSSRLGTAAPAAPAALAQRRHYEDSYKSHLV